MKVVGISEQNWQRIYFLLIIIFAMGSIFYVSHSYIDPFFTSGMLWTGYIVAVGWVVWLLGSKGIVRVPRMVGYWGAVLVAYIVVAWCNGSFSVQHFSFLLALYGLMWLFAQGEKDMNGIGVCICIASIGAVEALWGIGQWMGWVKGYNSLLSVTGSFDNPAGYAEVLAVCMPFALHVVCRLKGGGRWYSVIVSVILLVGILLSGSRTGIMAMGVVVAGCVSHYIRWNMQVRRWLLLVGVLAGVVLVIGLYFVRRDSADGRLLVWRCTWELIGEKPVMGHGAGSFGGRYMPVQARYLTEHPNERHDWLAGNVKHPFNEYLKLWVEYGVAGLIVVAIGVAGVLRRKREEDEICFVARMSVMALGVCGMFSYPLNYPSICCLLAINGGLLLRYEKGWNVNRGWARGIGVPVCVALLGFTVYWQRMERYWYRTSQLALSGTMNVLPDYERLYAFMGRNPLFLYNYGAELHARELWRAAAVQLEICAKQLNDTDVQLLLAECYAESGDKRRAEVCFILASQMCPNLFVPEYQLVELYRSMGREREAMEIAHKLLQKPVKVQTYVAKKIQREMQEYLRGSKK